MRHTRNGSDRFANGFAFRGYREAAARFRPNRGFPQVPAQHRDWATIAHHIKRFARPALDQKPATRAIYFQELMAGESALARTELDLLVACRSPTCARR